MARSAPTQRGITRMATAISMLVGLIAFIGFVHAQSFAIFPPPATPTSTDVLAGPPPAAADLNAQPLPGPPDPALASQTYTVGNTPPEGIIPSIPLPANMLGFSIELSVADDFLGDKIGEPNYQLLNYFETIRARAGRGPVVRIGGNTQDTAIFNESFTGIITKTGGGIINGVPVTPSIEYGDVVFRLISQVAKAVNGEMIWGVNMVNNTAPFTVPMVAEIRKDLDSTLLFYLVGNEPDRYPLIGNRAPDYSIPQYLSEWGALTQSIIDSDYSDDPKQFAAPAICCQWTTQQVLDAGLSSNFSDRLAAISAIQYPQSRCSSTAPYGHAGYMNQSAIVAFSQFDADAVATAVATNTPYFLVETNTASCVGIVDVSDTFTAAVWAVNVAFQFGYRNHTGVLLHNGGQTTVYNTFWPPAYNSSNRIVSAKAWRTGPIFYSTLVLAEALAPSQSGNVVTVTDQLIQSNVAAAYNVYENGVCTKQAFINMVNDPSGANNFQVSFPQPASGPASVPYKILTAPSLAEKDNITWAGQTFGWWSEGYLKGTETILQAPCNNGACTLSVPAPGVALAFVADTSSQQASVTTTAFHPIGTNNPQIVLQSNGERGRRGGATSRGSAVSAAMPNISAPRLVPVACLALTLSFIAALL